jgi:hypothetical protein
MLQKVKHLLHFLRHGMLQKMKQVFQVLRHEFPGDSLFFRAYY